MLSGTSRDTNQNVILLQGTVGKVYFGGKGVFGLCRYQSLQMVATTCRLWNKIEFVNHCAADTSSCVEFCMISVQRACSFGCGPRNYFLATFDEIDTSDDVKYCKIESLHLRICLMYDHSGITTFFENTFDIYDDEEALERYRGVAFPEACSGERLLIPSDSEIETHHLEAILQRPTFLIAIWTSDGRAVTPLPWYASFLLLNSFATSD